LAARIHHHRRSVENRARGRRLRVEALEERALLAATPHLVQDINQVPLPVGSEPAELVDVNGTLFFAANDGIVCAELWKTNSATGATTLVKDIWPGEFQLSLHSLTHFGGVLYFVSSTPDAQNEIWRSDGTESGTLRMRPQGSSATFSDRASEGRQ
jgi:ELWxxDGT repeat protein